MCGRTSLLNDYRGNTGNASSEIRYYKHSAEYSWVQQPNIHPLFVKPGKVLTLSCI